MGGKVSKNAPDNAHLSSTRFIMSPWLVKKVILVAISAVSEGILTKDPHPYPLVYIKGGGEEGSAPTMRTRRDRKRLRKIQSEEFSWYFGKCGKYLRGMDVNQSQYLSPAG